MSKDKNNLESYFEEPIIRMRFFERIIIRIARNIFISIFIAIAIAFLLSPFQPFFWLGVLMSLILFDRFLHRDEPKRFLSELPEKGKVNIAEYISPHFRKSLIIAHEKWVLEKGNFLLHLVSILLEVESVREALSRLDINSKEFNAKLAEYIKNSNRSFQDHEVKDLISLLAILAFEESIKMKGEFVSSPDLLIALTRTDDEEVKKLLNLFQINSDDLEKVIILGKLYQSKLFEQIPRNIGGLASRRLRGRVMNRAWTARPTPTLDQFATDYSWLARSGEIGFMVGHEEEFERMLSILSSRVNPNALLVGESGIGKSALIAHLAYKVSKDQVPAELFDKRLVELDIGRLVASADQAELQARIQKIFQEIYEAGNIILLIPDIENLSKTSGEKQINASNTILPLILNNDFPLVATTTPLAYKEYIERDGSFSKALDVVRINELNVDDAIRVLMYEVFFMERDYKIKISFGAIKAAVQIAKKYFASTPLPGSARDLLKESLAYASRHQDKLLSADDVITTAEARAKIPIKRAGQAEAADLLNLEEIIHKDLVDQELAVGAVSKALREYRSGLARRGGPIGTFLFVGPTGVGKTELSKILAKIQFGSSDLMIRFDMSQYQDKQSVFQFVGSPDGKMTGLLTDRVLERPYSLILLDEFEKAHPDILNIFLQVFDDGRLTDNFGRVINFENTIIIATSNANSDFIKTELEKGQSIEEISVEIKKKLSNYFRPELVNRFSSVVIFRELRKEDILEIARRQLKSLVQNISDSQGITLEISEAAVSKIAELGYDPVFGARPLREVISNKIKDPLSKEILRGRLIRGSKAKIDLVQEEISLSV